MTRRLTWPYWMRRASAPPPRRSKSSSVRATTWPKRTPAYPKTASSSATLAWSRPQMRTKGAEPPGRAPALILASWGGRSTSSGRARSSCTSGSSSRPWLEPPHDRGDPLPEADAHRREPVAAARAFQLVEQGGEEPGPRAPQRVAEGDGAAVHVHLRHVRTH